MIRRLFPLLAVAIGLLSAPGCVTAQHQGAAVAASSNSKSVHGQTLTGIDVLTERKFDILKGKRVGLVTNHTGLTRDAVSTIDVLNKAEGVKLTALFGPEHGIRGTADEKVASGTDEATGLPVYSLYGKTQKPTAEMLKDVDVLVFDIQDIGTRFYTYIGTMALVMQAAKENGKECVILDRPNPIGGEKVEGIVIDASQTGKNTAIYPIPTRHGMTVGELAKMFNEKFGIGCKLTVVPMKNWTRDMYWDETGLLWVNPSPNMKTLNGAILYPGLGAGETTTLSCGRGTDRPFEIYGAPYMDGTKIAANFNARNIPGIRLVNYDHLPTAKYHNYEGKQCHGVYAIISDRNAFDSVEAGFAMFQAMHDTHPAEFKPEGGFKGETGSDKVWDMLMVEKKTPRQVLDTFEPSRQEFLKERSKYLLY